MNNRTCGFAAVVALFLSLSGCTNQSDRPAIGEVSGVVTLDGEPLANASVAFSQDGFRPAIGETNSEGRYELFYIRDIKGATVGTNTVRIKQFGNEARRLPRRFNVESELSREVQPGQNEINFDLKSDS